MHCWIEKSMISFFVNRFPGERKTGSCGPVSTTLGLFRKNIFSRRRPFRSIANHLRRQYGRRLKPLQGNSSENSERTESAEPVGKTESAENTESAETAENAENAEPAERDEFLAGSRVSTVGASGIRQTNRILFGFRNSELALLCLAKRRTTNGVRSSGP